MSFFKDFGTGMPSDEDTQDLSVADEAVESVTEENLEVEESIEEEEAAVAEEPEAELADNDLDEDLIGMMMETEEEKVVAEPKRPEITEEDKTATTVITKGTTINGSMISDCSLDIMGTINGDIECLGKLTVSGTVVGNIMASEIYINANRLEGNLTSEGSIKIGLGTVILGNLNGTSAVIAGAVKGEIDINGPVIIDSTAIIKGNVKAKSVQMNNGAVLEGFCSLTYASLDIDNVFE